MFFSGKSLYNAPQCFIVVDRCIISKIPVKPLRAILSVFMCHFVFKAEYPKGVAYLLEFIQRFVDLNFDVPISVKFVIKSLMAHSFSRAIFEIEGDPNSSRIERRKNRKGHYDANPQGPSCRYSSLIAAYDDYKNIWAA